MNRADKIKKLMVVAGGTGGHVFPALAVALRLRAEGWQICWLGTADRMEADLVPKQGIPIKFITVSGLRGKGIKALVNAPLRICRAIGQAKRIMCQFRPDVVLGMGGYVSGPGGIAARLCGIPLVIHEQNGVAGLTNKWLARVANQVLQAFPGAFKHARVVGNPVRAELAALPTPQQRYQDRTGPLRVLILGGSQGARILNNIVPSVYQQLGIEIQVWHQTGRGAKKDVCAAYGSALQKGSKITEFIDDMAEAYAWADVVICRSGALTVSEITVAGLAAIFVPFAHKDRQQYFNAKPLADAGAAVILEQDQFTPEAVVQLLTNWDRKQLLIMAKKSRKFGITDAAKQVAEVIKQSTK